MFTAFLCVLNMSSGEKRRRLDPNDAPAPESGGVTDAVLLEFTLKQFGVTRELMEDVRSGKSTLRSRLDDYIENACYKNYRYFTMRVTEDETRRHFDENSGSRGFNFLSLKDFEDAVALAETLAEEEELAALTKAKEAADSAARGESSDGSSLSEKLDEHMRHQGYGTYTRFRAKLDWEGVNYYYESYADCSEFSSFREFDSAADLADELARIEQGKDLLA